MADDKRSNPYPFPTAEEVAAAPGDRADKAARNIVSRRIDGIPKRGYVLGDCDHAPVVKGVRDFAEAVYSLLDALVDDGLGNNPTQIDDAARKVAEIMEDHRCPTAAA